MEHYNKQDYALGNGLFLSERQVAVLNQLAQGLSNKQIAHVLGQQGLRYR